VLGALLLAGVAIAGAASVDIAPILVIALGIVMVQWALGPTFVQWAIPAEEIAQDQNGYRTTEPIGAIVAHRCRDAGVPLVRLGVVDDDVPNAFTFGRHRRDARVWVTRGLLERLDEDELDAVVAHEIGHIRNRDFVLMTIASIVPLFLYVVARALVESGEDDDDDEGGAGLLGLAVFLLYFASEFVVLWLSRAREFAADHWSCESTGNGDALVAALVKIGYGMTVAAAEPERSVEVIHRSQNLEDAARLEKQERRQSRGQQIMRAMGIFDRGAVGGMSNGFVSGLDGERVVAALRWEGANPWARVFEKLSTHPLVGRRIAVLEQSGLPGRPKWLGLEVARPDVAGTDHGRLRLEFLTDLVAVVAPWVALAAALTITLVSAGAPLEAGVLLVCSGGLFAAAHARRYPFEFVPVDAVTSLLERIDASPVRGIPVEVRGRVVGRATPGYLLSADLVVEDPSGIVALDYRQPIPFADSLFGFFRAKQFIGENVVARGWYRRTPDPVIELRELHTDDGRRVRPWLWIARFVAAGSLVVTGLALIAAQLVTSTGA
jgi:Zn-dependent protease with chaperone function